MGLPAGFIALVALASVPSAVTTLKISDAVRSYVQTSPIDERVILNFDDVLRFDLSVDWKHSQLTLSYAPQLTLVDATGDDYRTLAVWQGLEGRYTLRNPRWELSLSEAGSIGQQVVTGAAPVLGSAAPPSPGQTQVDLQPRGETTVFVANSRSNASFTYLWSRRWGTGVTAGYAVTGGLNDEDQNRLPQQRSVDVGLLVGHDVSPLIRLTVTATGTRTQTSGGFYTPNMRGLTHHIGDLMASWSARLGPNTGYIVDVGAAAWETRQDDEKVGSGASPAGGASITHSVDLQRTRTNLSIGAGFAPIVNTLTGDLQKRVYGNASAGLGNDRRSITLSVDAAQTVPTDEPDAARFLGAGLILSQRLSRSLDLIAGGQLLHQRLESADLSTTLWLAYVGLRVETEKFKL